MHRVEDAALHRLETVAGIGQGPAHDHAHRVFQIRPLHLLMQLDRLDAPVVGWIRQRLIGARLGHPLLRPGLKVALSLPMLCLTVAQVVGRARIGLGALHVGLEGWFSKQLRCSAAQSGPPELLLLPALEHVVRILGQGLGR